MTQEEIIEMAREAGIYHAQDSEYQWDGITDQQIIERTSDSAKDIEWRKRRTFEILERFANLVAAKEREACAQMVEKIETYEKVEKACFKFAATAIRARGEQA